MTDLNRMKVRKIAADEHAREARDCHGQDAGSGLALGTQTPYPMKCRLEAEDLWRTLTDIMVSEDGFVVIQRSVSSEFYSTFTRT